MAVVTFKDLCIDTLDPPAAARFWATALGLRIQWLPDDPDGVVLRGVTSAQTVWLCTVPEPKTVKNRVHVDVWAPSLDWFADLRRLSEPGEFPWVVYASPEGDEFCVFTDASLAGPRLKDLEVDADDHGAIAAWWAEVFGATAHDDEGQYSYVHAVPGAPFEDIDFASVPEPKTVKNRVHWDVTLTDGSTVNDLVVRGATVLRERDGEIEWTVMADPEGNEFCVFDPA